MFQVNSFVTIVTFCFPLSAFRYSDLSLLETTDNYWTCLSLLVFINMWTPLYLKAYEGVWQPLYFIIQIKFKWAQRNCLWIPFLILITSHAKMKCSVRGFLCRSCASTFRILKRTILWPLLFFPHIDLPIVCACQFSESRMYVRMYVDDTHLTYTVYLHISAPFMLLKIEICPICTTAKKLILNTT